MSKTYLFRLFFKNALHIGASMPGIGIEGSEGPIIHSDTLWAAICNNWAVVGKINGIVFGDFLESFKTGSPYFSISSAFPLTESIKYWFPKPLADPFILTPDYEYGDDNRQEFGKDIKRKKFVLRNDLKEWFEESLELDSFQEDSENSQIDDTVIAHNTLDRRSEIAAIYHSGTTYFNPSQSGLYFLLRTKNEDMMHATAEVFEIIKKTSGVGGNRHIGQGTIREISVTNVNSDWPSDEDCTGTNAFYLMSVYHPGPKDDFLNNAVAYHLLLRKGWTGSLSTGRQAKRKSVWMFSEGSVFLKNRPKGQLVNITPENLMPPFPHDVLRNGFAYAVPIKIKARSENDE